jgi:hypothetical protein
MLSGSFPPRLKQIIASTGRARLTTSALLASHVRWRTIPIASLKSCVRGRNDFLHRDVRNQSYSQSRLSSVEMTEFAEESTVRSIET